MIFSQTNISDYSNPKEYTISSITVSGTKYLDKNTLISISGLEIGEKIIIPGEDISLAIKKLWKQGLFSDISINIVKIEEENIYLNIDLKEHSKLSKFNFEGEIKKHDVSELKEQLKLMRGKVLTDNLINNSIYKIELYFKEKGFNNIQVTPSNQEDKQTINASILTFNIKKGERVKIKEIIIHGRELRKNEKKSFYNKADMTYALSDFTVSRKMKETKTKKWWRFFKVSKFNEDNLQTDLDAIISKYNEQGYRDARILKDTSYLNSDNTLSIEVWIHEGNPFKFRNITFVGNTKYSNEELSRILSIKAGDIFDKSILRSRIEGSATGNDISSLYLDDGYLFFNANPIETATQNNEIDLEIRIHEGEQARINMVVVNGNIKTNDHVIMREIRTKPGDLFKRSDIIRTQRELAALDYFNPETLGNIDIEPDPVRNTVNITYNVEEKSSDKINLQGGWGAGRVIGTLMLEFKNFSSSNLFKPNQWGGILPSGDGQRLTLSASSNGVYYQNYRLSFMEPWMGGKKPTSLSLSLYRNVFSNGQEGDDRESTQITGVTIGIGKRLQVPDDFFTFSNSVNFQQYKLENSQSFFSFKDGTSNNINYTATLGRNSVDQPTFPRRGSSFSLSLKVTPPYSLFRDANYADSSDQVKYKYMEFYKWNFKSKWFSSFTDKLVLATRLEMGLLGMYNKKMGAAPFERFYVGGDGLSGMGYQFDGRELISLRGYSNNSVSPTTGGTIYNRYSAELRYAISLNPASTVYVLGFLEAGNSWDSFDYFNPFSVKRSAGVGVRITIPMMGLMGLDYGWGLDEIPGNPDANGGQFHFSIGQNF
ncbi:MAG: outer membrane protein assembly factor BamA [Flavobacteriales bacterium]|tara:strand:+ start:5829 stop:8300 length:2472 start_codon:yes stop_codon:yes gene_type:complete